MTRATLEFLATDAKTYGYKKSPCQPCATYADLRQFVKKNNLTRADQLISDVQKRAGQSSPAELRTYLLKRVTEGADHAHRTKLSSFPTYQRALAAAVSGQPVAAAEPAAPGDVNGAAGDTGVTDAPLSTNQDIANQSDAPANPQPSMLSWLPLVLSLLSLAGVILLFRRGQSPAGSTSDVDKSILDELSKRVSKLEDSNKNLFNQVAFLEKAARPSSGNAAVGPNQPRPAQPAQPPTNVPAAQPAQPPVASVPPTPAGPKPPAAQTQSSGNVSNAATPVNQPVPTAANTPRQPQPAAPTLFYGRTADLGDGFSVGGLSPKPDRDTVFEIRRLDAGRAEFQVSDNPDLQRLALSDPYSYLNDTCTYATQPRPGSRIQTERPGTLSLQGEKWLITEKAQINFIG